MLNILFLTRYGRLGASSRYRFMQYEQALSAEGIACHFSPLLEDDYLANRYQGTKGGAMTFGRSAMRRLLAVLQANRYDVVVLQGEALPYAPAVLEKFFSFIGVPYVVDFDDAIFHYYDENPKRIIRALLGNKIRKVIKGSACVFAGNDYLADYARKSGAKQVEYIPTVVDLVRYSVSPKESAGFKIGWIGSPGSSRYLSTISEAFKTIGKDSHAKLVLVGAGDDFQLSGISIERLRWTEDTEVGSMQKFDVGIMPLPDDPWARGKCGLKLIQYMACGLPVVASPVGVNTEIVEHGINGFLAATDQEWTRALETLRTSPQLARKMGEAGREKVARRYSLHVTGPQMARAFRTTAGK